MRIAEQGSTGAGELACFLRSRRSTVPPIEQATAWADALTSAGQPIEDLSRALGGLGWRVATCSLGAAEGGLQAMTAPEGPGFTFLVDPEPTPSQRVAWGDLDRQVVSRHILNSRLAHELAHIRFYGLDGQRLLRQSVAEERFCDAFADALYPYPEAS